MTTRVRKVRADKGIRRALRKIPPEDAKQILAEAVEVADKKIEEGQTRQPGQTIEGTKVPWTRRDMEERFPIVELLSEETIKITWNGVVYQLLEGATHYVPQPIRESYLRHRQGMRQSGKSFGEGRGFDTVIKLGAGSIDWAKE